MATRPQPHRRQRAAPVRDRRPAAGLRRLGSELGKPYGHGGIGDGQMPGFGLNPTAVDPMTATATGMNPAQTMYTQDQIAAVVAYERSL